MTFRSFVPRAFTLIEVLIGVLVLALALLGLAALFPVVAREQRQARETILSVSADSAAEATLKANVKLNVGDPVGDLESGWTNLRSEICANGVAQAILWSSALPRLYPTDQNPRGILLVPYGPSADTAVRLTPKLRLFPEPTAEDNSPTPVLVWDMVACAKVDPVTTADDFPIRVAVFSRRIDPQIRTAQGVSLARALFYGNAAGVTFGNPAIVPVAQDINGLLTGTGQSGSGSPIYAAPRAAKLTIVADPDTGVQNMLRISAKNATEAGYIRQLGQKLVDNRGVIYTVTKLPSLNGGSLGSLVDVVVDPLPPVESMALRGTRLEVAYVPQVPISVKVFEVGEK